MKSHPREIILEQTSDSCGEQKYSFLIFLFPYPISTIILLLISIFLAIELHESYWLEEKEGGSGYTISV